MRFATLLLLAALAATPSEAQSPRASYYEPQISDQGKIPDGFTPIFNGKDLTGWHVSRTNHHGTTPEYRVVHGLIVGTQNPRGRGGILLTDRKYRAAHSRIAAQTPAGSTQGRNHAPAIQAVRAD